MVRTERDRHEFFYRLSRIVNIIGNEVDFLIRICLRTRIVKPPVPRSMVKILIQQQGEIPSGQPENPKQQQLTINLFKPTFHSDL